MHFCLEFSDRGTSMPPYIAVFIQNIGDKENPYVFAGTETNGKLISDVFDHGINHQCVTQSITIQRRRKTDQAFSSILKLENISARFIYTDCRVVYRCDEYDLGPTWSRSPMSGVMNYKEERKAHKRMAGKILLGHVRYEWIKEIAYIERALRVVYRDMEDTTYFIEAAFDQAVDTSVLANDMLHRACRYLLALTDQKDAEEMAFYTRFSEEVIPPTPGKELSRIIFPTSYMAPFGKEYRPLIYEPVQRKSFAVPMNPEIDRVVGAADSIAENAPAYPTSGDTAGAAYLNQQTAAGYGMNPVPSMDAPSAQQVMPQTPYNADAGQVAPSMTEPSGLLKEYEDLLAAGVISEEEFNKRKEALLGRGE